VHWLDLCASLKRAKVADQSMLGLVPVLLAVRHFEEHPHTTAQQYTEAQIAAFVQRLEHSIPHHTRTPLQTRTVAGMLRNKLSFVGRHTDILT
jgi:hypothetical protein